MTTNPDHNPGEPASSSATRSLDAVPETTRTGSEALPPSSENVVRTVLELDLVSYSDIARVLEENLNVRAVMAFQDQIQSFVDQGLAHVGLRRDDVVLGTPGDNAILIFDDAATTHRFSEAVHQATLEHNRRKTVESAKRWFRMGAATGTVLVFASERRVIGTTIARAVRLEAAAKIGELVIDIPTFKSLPEDLRSSYGDVEEIEGKRDERFTVRRCAHIPLSECSPTPSKAPIHAGTRPSKPRRLWSALAVVAVLAVIVLVMTRNGAVKLTLKGGDDSVDVKVDGEDIAITGLDEPIKIRPGDHEGVEQLIRTLEPDSSFLPRKWNLLQSLHKDGANDDIYGIALSPDGTLLATADAGQTLRLWEVDNGQIRKVIRNYRSASSEVQSPVFLNDGKRFLFVFGRHRLAELWRIDDDKPLALFQNDPNSETWKVAVSPNEEMLALTGKSGIVTLWSTLTGQPLRRIEHGLSGEFVSPFMAFSADNKRLACGTENAQVISICDCANGQKVGALVGHTANVVGVAYGRKGRLVASAARDGTIRIWSASSEKLLRQCAVENVPINSLAMSSDERLIATGLNDGSVVVWDSETGRRLDVLQTNNSVHAFLVTFSLDGRRLAAASESNYVRVWQAEFE